MSKDKLDIQVQDKYMMLKFKMIIIGVSQATKVSGTSEPRSKEMDVHVKQSLGLELVELRSKELEQIFNEKEGRIGCDSTHFKDRRCEKHSAIKKLCATDPGSKIWLTEAKKSEVSIMGKWIYILQRVFDLAREL